MAAGKLPNTIIELKDIKKILQVLLGNWHIVLVCVLVSAVAAYFYSYRLPKIYAARTQVILKSDEIYPIQQNMLQDLGFYYSWEKMSNEKNIIASTDIISQVVSKVKSDVSYYIVGRLHTGEVYAGTPFSVDAKIYNGRFYDLPFTIKIISPESFGLSYESEGKQVDFTSNFGEPILNSEFYIVINKSSAVNSTTIESIREITYQFKVHEPWSLVNRFQNNLKVADLEYTAILQVTLEDEIPERAVAFLDTLTRVYIDNSLKTKIRVNENTIKYIDKQLEGVTNILDSIEDILENYKEQKNIIDLSKEEGTYYQRLMNFEEQKRRLELKLKSHEYLKNYITSNLNRELLPPSDYIGDEDSYLRSTVSQLYSLKLSINNALFTSTEKSTAIKETEYKIELLRSEILKYINGAEKAIQEKMLTVDEEIANYEGLLRTVPKNQREILNITRKMQVNEKMYLYLLEKRAETVIARANIVSDINVIESAHSLGVVKPDIGKIYSSFLSTGFLIAMLVGFMRAIFFVKIDNVEALKESTSLAILGEVYFSDEAKDNYMIVEANLKSIVTESFRSIRTNLEYMSPDKPGKGKVILVSSNRPGVGKTFCSVNLAAILAKGGKKVLLLEMDLHKPRLQRAFSVVKEVGMSTLLIGKSSIEESINTQALEGLDIITSGPIPPNASELILSENLRKLLHYARDKYDFVMIDTPPMGIISDAKVLMKYSDINIYVINAMKSPNESLQFAEKLSEEGIVSGLALVLNSVKPRNSKYYYKKYKYDYNVGYSQRE